MRIMLLLINSLHILSLFFSILLLRNKPHKPAYDFECAFCTIYHTVYVKSSNIDVNGYVLCC